MKTLLVMLLSLTLSVGASAQKRVRVPRVHRMSRVYVVPSLSFYGGWGFGYPYGYFGYPFGYFDYPFYGPYGYYRSPRMNALDQQISSIKSTYKFKIKAVRKDKALDRSQKKQEILALKSERESAIEKAQNQFFNKRLNTPQKSDSSAKSDDSGPTS